MPRLELIRDQDGAPIGIAVDGIPIKVADISIAEWSQWSAPRVSVPFGRIELRSLAALTALPFSELATCIADLDMPLSGSWSGMTATALITFPPEQGAFIRIFFYANMEHWAGPFSMAQYADAIRDALKREGIPVEVDHGHSGLHLGWPVRRADTPVQEEIDYWLGVVQPTLEQVRMILSEEVKRDTLVQLFRFAPATRAACEQYLVYFGQFLADLGIKATTDIRHREAGEVLFSVKPEGAPENLEEVLSRIHDALVVYLDLPYAPDLGTAASRNPDVAVLQLQANVQHLQSQVTLAHAVVRAQRAEIGSRTAEAEHLRLSNALLRQGVATGAEANQIAALPGPTAGEANDKADPSRPEPLLGGLVSAGTYERGGVNVHVGEIIRKLKRRSPSD